MKALILAAGTGSRLRPITEVIPKPLVPINGKTLLQYHLESLQYYGVTKVLINTHYLYKQIENFVSLYNRAYSNIVIITTYEEKLLGGAGTLKENRIFFEDQDDFIIVCGDNLTTVNYDALIAYHKQKGGVATIATYIETHPETKGIIVFDGNKRISQFIEKPKGEQIISNYANAGIYILNKAIFKYLNELDQDVLDFGFHVFPYLLKHDVPMYVYEMSEFLLDIGTQESYNRSQEIVKTLHFMIKENKFGGERLESKSNLSKNNLLEHLVRYNLLPGGDVVVLDIGCGAGHGSNMLAKKYKKVYGVDISDDAIKYAKENWNSRNIDFKVGSALAIPFPDNTFDTIAAFEVFEHLNDWRKFLSEIKRVLKPGGCVYISTPNKTLYSPGTKKPINPHHVFEMTIVEFKNALSDFFTIEEFYGQRTPVYNDHPIWKIINPFLFTFKDVIPYKVNNTIKLKIINWIKPELEMSDIVLKQDQEWVEKSRFVVGVCKNNK